MRLRESGNTSAQDALTGNYLNGDLHMDQGGVGTHARVPWLRNLWDQMLYKDFASAGSGTVAFRVAVDVSNFVDTLANGTGWFNPDPTNIANFVNNPADSFMVYVGSPTETAYDTNRRWFSEVLEPGQCLPGTVRRLGQVPVRERRHLAVAATTRASRRSAATCASSSASRPTAFARTSRRARPRGFNTKAGAALLDEVSVNGGAAEGFESAGQITARSLITNLAARGGAWATTGKPPAVYFHIDNVANLLYEDLCGAVGAPTRQCNLAGNVLVAGNNDNANLLEHRALPDRWSRPRWTSRSARRLRPP